MDPLSVESTMIDGYRANSLCELYHENSKARRISANTSISSQALKVMGHGFKDYDGSPSLELPQPLTNISMTLVEAIRRRRSVRRYSSCEIPLEAISTMLFSAYGQLSSGEFHRAVPSAGGLFPLEIYLFALESGDLLPGIYHYNIRRHCLERIPEYGDVSSIRNAVFAEEAASSASFLVAVTAMFGRTLIKYGERGYRFALLEAGHVMQNIALVCASMSIGFCSVGGFIDEEVNSLLGVDGVDEAAVYLGTIGALEY